jgi:hypothetical protein
MRWPTYSFSKKIHATNEIPEKASSLNVIGFFTINVSSV